MGQSPLKIEGYFLRKLEYHLKESFEAALFDEPIASADPGVQVDVEIGRHLEKENAWRVAIDVNGGGDDPDFPYTFEISFVGFFEVAETYPEDKRELLVTINGPSILYAAAREFVSIVTARSPYPSILLPSISFVPEQEPQKDAGKGSSKRAKPAKSAKKTVKKASQKK